MLQAPPWYHRKPRLSGVRAIRRDGCCQHGCVDPRPRAGYYSIGLLCESPAGRREDPLSNFTIGSTYPAGLVLRAQRGLPSPGWACVRAGSNRTSRQANNGGTGDDLMSEGGGSQSSNLQVVYNLDKILDAHTHLTGMEEESAESILECMDFCGIEKVFLFAPMLDVQAHEITSDSLDDIRTHNDYCADICSAAPERLLGFCTLNPLPDLAGGDLGRAVDLMVEEAQRCYDELGLRGAGELVPTHCYPHDPALTRLWQALA